MKITEAKTKLEQRDNIIVNPESIWIEGDTVHYDYNQSNIETGWRAGETSLRELREFVF